MDSGHCGERFLWLKLVTQLLTLTLLDTKDLAIRYKDLPMLHECKKGSIETQNDYVFSNLIGD
jgi:hypothetical protein